MIDWWIIEKSLKGPLSSDEQEQLQEWLDELPAHGQLYEKIKHAEEITTNIPVPTEWRSSFEQKLKNMERNRKKRLFARWGSVAALVVLALATGYWWQASIIVPENSFPSNAYQEPDRTKVRLVTAQGEIMDLSSQKAPDTLVIDGVQVARQAGQLSYDKNLSPDNIPVFANNKIEVPRGAEFNLTLSDGTKVWLNSDSQLKYPVAFSGDTREVEVNGEAYFEVTRDEKRPFIVHSSGMAVTVLGTEFNMNTRMPDNVKTILVKGKVQVAMKGGKPSLLKPGEMASTELSTGTTRVEKVNVQKYIAWRHGRYYFEDATIEDILNELSLWYDVEAEYQDNRLREERFSGYLRRGDSISSILNKIEQTTYIHFTIMGKRILVK